MRREWIEMMERKKATLEDTSSPSMRREWIEIVPLSFDSACLAVSLHAEGVD